MSDHTGPSKWPGRLIWTVAAIAAIAVIQSTVALTRQADAEQVRDIVASYYEDTRDDVVALCDDKDNADRPECAKTPPPAEDIVETPPDALPGPPGPPASMAQVDASVRRLLPLMLGSEVVAFCADDRCVGPRGNPGTDGDDSTVPGPQGEPGADSTVPGPQGEQGPPGEDGDDFACPEGTSLQETTVMTSPVDSAVIYACR